MIRKPVITPVRVRILSTLQDSPGINTAELDRRARTARGGHQWMYAAVDRAYSAGLVNYGPCVADRGVGLYVTEKGEKLLKEYLES